MPQNLDTQLLGIICLPPAERAPTKPSTSCRIGEISLSHRQIRLCARFPILRFGKSEMRAAIQTSPDIEVRLRKHIFCTEFFCHNDTLIP